MPSSLPPAAAIDCLTLLRFEVMSCNSCDYYSVEKASRKLEVAIIKDFNSKISVGSALCLFLVDF